jgi:hypothetical protein
MSDTARPGTARRLSPAHPLSLALLCLLLTLYAETFYVFLVGFPDSYVCALHAAEKQLAIWFERISLILSVWFIYLGIAAFRDQVRKRVSRSVLFYALVIAACVALDMYFKANLDDGKGG